MTQQIYRTTMKCMPWFDQPNHGHGSAGYLGSWDHPNQVIQVIQARHGHGIHGTSMSSLPGMNQLFSQGKNGRYRSTNGDAAAETTQGQLPWACPCDPVHGASHGVPKQWRIPVLYRSKIDIIEKQDVKIRSWVLAARVKVCI